MPPRILTISLTATLFLTGCQKDEVHTYRVPKEAEPAISTAAATSTPSASSGLSWTAPSHWEELPAGGVRRGSFKASNADGESADISIIAFPGDVGGLAANVNRWRDQVGLARLPDAEVQATIEHLDTPTFHIDFVNYVGTANGVSSRVAGAILEYQGESWFFKVIGPASIVDAELDAFRAFIQTIVPAR
jgi:hypothetical protein